MSRDLSPTAKQRILNVNDSEAGRYATSRILTRAGFEVLEATNGMDALALTAQRPDLVLLDVNLPDMSGFEVCKRIKTNPNLASVPVVHLSATCVASEQQMLGLEGGADGYLVQPVDATVLVATVRAFLRLTAAEAALRTSEDRYRDLVENSSDMVCTHDLGGNLLWVNRTAEHITGHSRDALLGMNLSDLMTDGSRAGFPAYLAEIQARGAARGVMRLRSATGEARWLEFNNTLRTEGVPVPVVRGMAQDVTERKKAEEEVRRQLDELRRWQAVMLDREDRNAELKREVNGLLLRLGEPIRYPSQAQGGSAAT